VQPGADAHARPTTTPAVSAAARLAGGVVAGLLTLLCGLAWKASLAWPVVHDLPIMLYTAMLWDRYDVVPHAGFFDMNVLGSYVAYLGIGRVFGYDAPDVRHADLAVFLALGGATVYALRSAGWIVGWISAAVFGLVYLQYGPGMSLQREYLMLLPLALSVCMATRVKAGSLRALALLAGLCIGIAMTVKPQAAVAAAPIGAFLAFEAARGEPAPARRRAAFHALTWLAAGAALVLCLLVASLAWLGVTGAFFEIVTRYLPLYGEMTGLHRILEPGERAGYLATHWLRFGRQPGWVLAGVVGAAACVAGLERRDPLRSRAALLLGLVAAFALYPLLSGKFWNYHWLPMVYWLVCCACLALSRLPETRHRTLRGVVVAGLAVMLVRAFPPAADFGGLLAPTAARSTTAEQLADFLGDRLLPADTVQPMDWTKGSVVHALLLSEAKAATSFIYDFHFYHHVSSPYVQGLRARFLEELDAARPRFIVRSRLGPFPTGPDTSRTFAGLQRVLRSDYEKVADTLAYTVYERRPGSAAGSGRQPATP